MILFGFFIDDADKPIQRVKIEGGNEYARGEGKCQKEDERNMAKPTRLADALHGREGEQAECPNPPQADLTEYSTEQVEL